MGEENALLSQHVQALENELRDVKRDAEARTAENVQLTVELGHAAAQVGASAGDAAESKRQYVQAMVWVVFFWGDWVIGWGGVHKGVLFGRGHGSTQA